MIENTRLLQAVSAEGIIAATGWLTRALYALGPRSQRPEKRLLHLCGLPPVHGPLCIFGSERAVCEPLSDLSEPQMFLDILEFYGTSMPSWVREERLLPRIREVSAKELLRIIETTDVPYVATNPSPPGEREDVRAVARRAFLGGHNARDRA